MHSGHSLLLSLIRIFPHPFPLPSCLLHLLHVPLLFHLILYSHVSSLLTKLFFHPHFLHLSKHHIHINRHRWRTIRYRVAQVQNLLDDSVSVIILYIQCSRASQPTFKNPHLELPELQNSVLCIPLTVLSEKEVI